MKIPRKPAAPRLPKRVDLAPTPVADMVDEALYERVIVTATSFADMRASHLIVDSAVFEDVKLSGSVLDNLRLQDVAFLRCDIANATWGAFDATCMRLTDCRMLGFKANEAHLQDVSFEECSAHFAQFRFADLKGVWFENCDLTDADFSGTDLANATFRDCDLTRVQLHAAKCAGTDFRGSILDGVGADPDALRGAIIDPVQAIVVAGVFGVRVLSEVDEVM